MAYDLLIRGGRVIDPAQHWDQIADVAVQNGCIAAIGPELSAEGCPQILAAEGKIVTPGLIDIHIHASAHEESGNIAVDTAGIKMGVTTVVDTGSSGVLGFPAFRKLVTYETRTRTYFIPVTSLIFEFTGGFIGLKIGSELLPGNFDLKKTAQLYEKHKDVIVGFKCIAPLAHEEDTDCIPLSRSKEITRALGLPLTVHLGWVPYCPWLTTPKTLEKLDAGDIATHIFRRRGHIFDDRWRVCPQVIEAQERGVLFDIGHGNGNFDFEMAKRGLDQGIKPYTITTDAMDRNCLIGPVVSLTETMSKFLYLGLSLQEVITMTTLHAAKAINKQDEIGSLALGRTADISILDYRDGDWKFSDGVNQVQWSGRKLIPYAAVLGGDLIYSEYPENSHHADEIQNSRRLAAV